MFNYMETTDIVTSGTLHLHFHKMYYIWYPAHEYSTMSVNICRDSISVNKEDYWGILTKNFEIKYQFL